MAVPFKAIDAKIARFEQLFRFWGTLSVLLLALVAVLFVLLIKPKRDVCQAYYPEISLYSCMMSNYGLPQPSKR
jgi:hypothetical protein